MTERRDSAPSGYTHPPPPAPPGHHSEDNSWWQQSHSDKWTKLCTELCNSTKQFANTIKSIRHHLSFSGTQIKTARNTWDLDGQLQREMRSQQEASATLNYSQHLHQLKVKQTHQWIWKNHQERGSKTNGNSLCLCPVSIEHASFNHALSY